MNARALVFAIAVLGIASTAYAHLEIEPGQLLEVFVGDDYSCRGIFEGISGGVFYTKELDPEIICDYPVSFVKGYRVIKPAPRPEFRLPNIWISCSERMKKRGIRNYTCYEHDPLSSREKDENDRAIADELRYLRMEIERLKNGR